MFCPFCGEKMILGHIQPFGRRSTFWLPDNLRVKDLPSGFVTVKGIEQVGGRVIGTATKFGLFSTSSSDSLLCKTCNLLITKL